MRAQRFAHNSDLPPHVDLIETGIGGMGIVQQLIDEYDSLIVIDTVDRGAAPGTIFVLEPEVPDPSTLGLDVWRERFSNLHLAEPSRVFLLARAAGALPDNVVVVGCQPMSCEEYAEMLSPPVQAAVAVACQRVFELVSDAKMTARS